MQLKGILPFLIFMFVFSSFCFTLPTTTKLIGNQEEGTEFSRRAFGYIQSTFGVARSNQRTITKTYLDKAIKRKDSGRYISSGIASTKAFVHSTPILSHVAASYLTAKKLVRMIKRSSSNSSPILIRRSITGDSIPQENKDILIQKRSAMKSGEEVLQHARENVRAGMKKVNSQLNGVKSLVSKGHTHQQSVEATFVKN